LGATARRSQSVLCLQVAVHEVDLLESAKALADVLLFLLDDLTGPVMRVHDVVAHGEVDALDLTADVEVFQLFGIGDDVLLGSGASACRTTGGCV
jgi:hypothetical protein